MKAYLNNLPTRTLLLLMLPAVAIAYPLVTMALPAAFHAVVPEVVRNVLSMM
jgi:hypothetical protein